MREQPRYNNVYGYMIGRLNPARPQLAFTQPTFRRFNDSTIQRFNDLTNPWHAKALATAATIHVATAHVLLGDISKILFPNNPVNVPVIK
jgi:hypothetical protein